MTRHRFVRAFVLVLPLASGAASAAAASPSGQGQQPAVSSQQPASAPGFPSATSRRSEAYYQFMTGRYLESEGDADGAIRAFREAARLDPKSAEILAELASLYAQENRFQDALTTAEAALVNDPKNVSAHRVLGILYASLARADEGSGPLSSEAAGQAAKAVEHLEAARRGASLPDTPLDLVLARVYLRTGEGAKAIQLLERVVTTDPGRPEALNLLLQAYERAGRSDDALKLLETTAPQQPELYATLAEQYARRQRWSDAAAAYERALARNPRNTEVRIRLAGTLLSDGGEAQATRAIEVLEPLRKDGQADGRVLYFLSNAERRAGRADDAERTARELTRTDPTGLMGPYALALALEAKQQYRQVIETLEPALARSASSNDGFDVGPLYVHLGFACVELGEFDRALAAFEGARKASPSNPAIDLYVLQTQVTAKRYPVALELAARLRAAYPRDQRVVRLEAEALRGTGRTDEGTALLTRAVDANPDDSSAYLALAEYQSQAGRADAALQTMERAAAKFPSDLSIVFQAGAILERHGRVAEAERKFREVLSKDPQHAPALNYLGYMLADRGERLEEAVGYIRRALQVEPNNGAYLDSLGWAYYRQNKLDAAEPYLRRAAEQHARGSAVQDHYGDLLYKMGRYDDAVAAWKRALAGDGEQIDRSAIDKKIKTAGEKAPKR